MAKESTKVNGYDSCSNSSYFLSESDDEHSLTFKKLCKKLVYDLDMSRQKNIICKMKMPLYKKELQILKKKTLS